jgi:hypothetical protein
VKPVVGWKTRDPKSVTHLPILEILVSQPGVLHDGLHERFTSQFYFLKLDAGIRDVGQTRFVSDIEPEFRRFADVVERFFARLSLRVAAAIRAWSVSGRVRWFHRACPAAHRTATRLSLGGA